MKVKFNDENNIIVFLNQYNNNFNFNSKDLLKNQLKDLFKKLNSIYKIKLYGYYNINIYIDELCGSVFIINKEDNDYIFYDERTIDMHISIVKNHFLYIVDDIFDFDIPCDIYCYKNKFYIDINKKLNYIEYGKLLEYSNIIYGSITDEIIKYGFILKNKNGVI